MAAMVRGVTAGDGWDSVRGAAAGGMAAAEDAFCVGKAVAKGLSASGAVVVVVVVVAAGCGGAVEPGA